MSQNVQTNDDGTLKQPVNFFTENSEAISEASNHPWVTKTGSYTAVKGDKILANTTSGAFTITLPASPSVGDQVTFIDAQDTWATHNLTIGRNGQSIMGVSSDISVSTLGANFGLVFSGGAVGWQRFSIPVSGAATWGSITGTLSSQTDLSSALDGKLDNGGITNDGSGNIEANSFTADNNPGFFGVLQGDVTGTASAASAAPWGGITGSVASQTDVLGTQPIIGGTQVINGISDFLNFAASGIGNSGVGQIQLIGNVWFNTDLNHGAVFEYDDGSADGQHNIIFPSLVGGDSTVAYQSWITADFLGINSEAVSASTAEGLLFSGQTFSFSAGKWTTTSGIAANSFTGDGSNLTGLLLAGASQNAQLTGTAYTTTSSYASIVGGTTSPTLTIAASGDGYLSFSVASAFVGATFAGVQSISIKLRRTNNTAADIGFPQAQPLPVITALTGAGPSMNIVKFPYTATAGDVITIQAILSASPGAGSVTITGSNIVWEPR